MGIVAGHITVEAQQRVLPRGLCAYRRTSSSGSCLPRRRDLRGPGRPRPCQHLRALESQAALETFRSSGPDTEQRRAMLTVSVQENDPPTFGRVRNNRPDGLCCDG